MMEGTRKLAVSFGSFACVIEGFDDPFPLMQDVVGHFGKIAAENPGFARFDEIADFEELRDLLARDGEEIALERIAGGVQIRRLTAAAADGEGTVEDEAPAAPSAREDEAGAAHEDAPEAGEAQHAALDADEAQEAAPLRLHDDGTAGETAGTQEDDVQAANAEETEGNEADGGETDEGETGDRETEDAPLSLAQGEEEPARTGDDAERSAAAADETTREEAAADTPFESTGEEPRPAPLRLGEAAASGPADEAETRGRPAESAEDPGTTAAPLRLEPRTGDAKAGDTRSGHGALRLGPELAAQDGEREKHLSFVDTLAARNPAPPPPERPAPPRAEEIAPEIDKAMAEDASEPEASAALGEAEKTGAEEARGRRFGSFLRRKPTAPGDGPAAPPQEPAAKPVEAEEEEDGHAEPPSRANVLRVVDSDPGTPVEPEPVPAAPPRGLRALLRGGRKPEPPPAAPAAEAEPEPPAPESVAPPPEPVRKPGENPIADRLHASFADVPEPRSSATVLLDLDEDAATDVSTPHGFARAIGGTALPDLMAAAGGYLIMNEGRTGFSRGELMDVLRMITGDTPISAEAKVKAFGRLVRTGELVRLDGGTFTLSAAAIAAQRARIEAAE